MYVSRPVHSQRDPAGVVGVVAGAVPVDLAAGEPATAVFELIEGGRIEGGVRNNVIPDEVELEGTIRTFDPAMREEIHRRIEQTARGIAAAAGAEIDFELELGYPSVYNDPGLYDRMLPTLQRVVGTVAPAKPHTTAEDFSYFALETPGLYMRLANGAPDADPATLAPNHSPFFDMYEPNLETGVRVFSHLVADYLRPE